MYRLKWHKGLATRWHEFPRDQQILAIASELNRVKNFIIRRDTHELMNAYERAFELLDLTINISYSRPRYELLRFREMLAHQYLNDLYNIELTNKLFEILISLDKDSFNALHTAPES